MNTPFPKNKLNIHIETSGPDADKHCILQLTAWPVTPPPFADTAFTTLVQPYRGVSKAVKGTPFEWALAGSDNPIWREADTVYGAWLSLSDYLTKLYIYPEGIKTRNQTRLKDGVFYRFLYNMHIEYLLATKSTIKWPFEQTLSNFI